MNNHKKSAELIATNQDLIHQISEKEQSAYKLMLANKDLTHENAEREIRSAALTRANEDLQFNNDEKERRAAELVIANIELAFQNTEKEDRAAELIIANQELAYQFEEKEKRASELDSAYKELKRAEGQLKEHITGLEEMMFITSHKVRIPVANILGISNIIDDFMDSPVQLKTLLAHIKTSAETLDAFTTELAQFMSSLEQKSKEINLQI